MWTESSYFICTIPRSGSWLLSETLEQTGIAGRPREYFHEKFEEEHFAAWNIASYGDFLQEILARGTTPNGVFGSKLHWYQFEQVHSKLGQIPGLEWMELPELLAACFPALRFVWLTRRDKERQAVSHYRAIATGRWWDIAGRAAGRVGAADEIEFDYSAIARLEQMARAQEASWERFFCEASIDPMVVTYEELAERRAETVSRVLRFLDIPSPANLDIDVRLRRQADDLSEQWLSRYVQLKGEGRPIDFDAARRHLRGDQRKPGRHSAPSHPGGVKAGAGAGLGPSPLPSGARSRSSRDRDEARAR